MRSLRCRLLGHPSDCTCNERAQKEEEPAPKPVPLEASPVAIKASKEYRRKTWRR